MTFCQKIDFTLVSKGTPPFDSSSCFMERKGLLIIRDIEQPLWVVRHKGHQDTSNEGAIAWGSSTGLGNLVFVQKAQLSFLLVTVSTKLGCFQHWWSILLGLLFWFGFFFSMKAFIQDTANGIIVTSAQLHLLTETLFLALMSLLL